MTVYTSIYSIPRKGTRADCTEGPGHECTAGTHFCAPFLPSQEVGVNAKPQGMITDIIKHFTSHV